MQEKYLTPSPSIEKQKEDICSNRSNSQSRFSISRVGREKQRYDGEKRLLACIVVTKFEVEQNQPQVLLISSSKYPNEWVLPKGGWENDEGILVCALREVEEEAGVTGEITKMLGTLDFYSKQKKPCRFYGFQLQVTREFDEWPEKENRKRQWVSFKQAQKLLGTRPELLELLRRAFFSS